MEPIFEKLKGLTAPQLDDLCQRLGLGIEYLPGREVAPASRAVEILRLVRSQDGGLTLLETVMIDLLKPLRITRTIAPPPYYRAKVSYSNRYNACIDDYLDDVAEIWKRDLTDRQFGLFDISQHVFDHASRVSRAIRLERPTDVIDDLADTSVWLMSFIALCRNSTSPVDRWFHFETKLSDLIWNKYPGMCPVCFDFHVLDIIGLPNGKDLAGELRVHHATILGDLAKRAERLRQPETCICLSRTALNRTVQPKLKGIRQELNQLRVQYADMLRKNGKQHKSMLELNQMFEAIFINATYVWSLENIGFHLLEKVGAMTRAFKDIYTYDEGREPFSESEYQYRLLGLQDEIADVFSWMFATELKIVSVYYRDAQEYIEGVFSGRMKKGLLRLPEMNFADVIWSKYGRAPEGGVWDQLRCPGCMAAPCACNRDLRLPGILFSE